MLVELMDHLRQTSARKRFNAQQTGIDPLELQLERSNGPEHPKPAYGGMKQRAVIISAAGN